MAVHLESVCVSNQVHSLAEVSTDIFSISIKLNYFCIQALGHPIYQTSSVWGLLER